MLHSILLISTSGIVLFHKEFVNGLPKVQAHDSRERASEAHSEAKHSSTRSHRLSLALCHRCVRCQSKQIGGVITAMLKFSMQKTGLPVSYIQLANVGVSIASSADARCTCAVFHDPDDGSDFGKLLSRELLYSFTQTYSIELMSGARGPSGSGAGASSSSSGAQGGGVYDMDHFAEFQSKIALIIRNAVKPLLDQCKGKREVKRAKPPSSDPRSAVLMQLSLCRCVFSVQEQRGIALVLLSSSSSESDPQSALQHSTQEVDKLAVLANHQALMGVATDISQTTDAHRDDNERGVRSTIQLTPDSARCSSDPLFSSGRSERHHQQCDPPFSSHDVDPPACGALVADRGVQELRRCHCVSAAH